MVHTTSQEFYIIISILVVSLITLLLIKSNLVNKLNRKKIRFVKGSTIGNEELQENSSSVVEAPFGTLAVLADGLGKNESGRISSIVSVKTFTRLFLEHGTGEKIHYFFKKAFNTTNNEILMRIDKGQGGASVASAVIINDLLYYGLIGNTMICIFRKGELVKLSEGHTINVLAKKGFYEGKIKKEDAISALNEKKILHYLGQEDFCEIEMLEVPVTLKSGDIIVLMSKGIYDGIKWTALEDTLNKNTDFDYLANDIIKKVKMNSKKERENGSIILIRYTDN